MIVSGTCIWHPAGNQVRTRFMQGWTQAPVSLKPVELQRFGFSCLLCCLRVRRFFYVDGLWLEPAVFCYSLAPSALPCLLRPLLPFETMATSKSTVTSSLPGVGAHGAGLSPTAHSSSGVSDDRLRARYILPKRPPPATAVPEDPPEGEGISREHHLFLRRMGIDYEGGGEQRCHNDVLPNSVRHLQEQHLVNPETFAK